MKPATLLYLLFAFMLLGAADLACAKTDTGAGGPAPVPYKHEASFSRRYKPSIKPEHPARPVKLVKVVYPAKWKQWGQPAYALVVFLIDDTGYPQEIQCTEATDRAFATAALKAVEQSLFFPALKNQQAVWSKFEARLDFTLTAPSAEAAAPATPAAPAKP